MNTNERRKIAALILALLGAMAAACNGAPTSPSLAQPVTATLGYTINVPNVATAAALRNEFPQGIALAPIAAQARFDYTSAYHGSPNVYYGATAPDPSIYHLTGIVVAPYAVANQAEFFGREWASAGLDALTLYRWVGTFEYAEARQ